MNHFYQVIRSNKTFTVHEYMYGVRSNNSVVYPIDEMGFILSKIPHHFTQLATIRGNEKTVKDSADIK